MPRKMTSGMKPTWKTRVASGSSGATRSRTAAIALLTGASTALVTSKALARPSTSTLLRAAIDGKHKSTRRGGVDGPGGGGGRESTEKKKVVRTTGVLVEPPRGGPSAACGVPLRPC
jgi:hypothetical protein